MSERLLSSKETMEILGITKPTLFKWISLKKIKPMKKRFGNRIFLKYDESEIAGIKSLMRDKRVKRLALIVAPE